MVYAAMDLLIDQDGKSGESGGGGGLTDTSSRHLAKITFNENCQYIDFVHKNIHHKGNHLGPQKFSQPSHQPPASSSP